MYRKTSPYTLPSKGRNCPTISTSVVFLELLRTATAASQEPVTRRGSARATHYIGDQTGRPASTQRCGRSPQEQQQWRHRQGTNMVTPAPLESVNMVGDQQGHRHPRLENHLRHWRTISDSNTTMMWGTNRVTTTTGLENHLHQDHTAMWGTNRVTTTTGLENHLHQGHNTC